MGTLRLSLNLLIHRKLKKNINKILLKKLKPRMSLFHKFTRDPFNIDDVIDRLLLSEFSDSFPLNVIEIMKLNRKMIEVLKKQRSTLLRLTTDKIYPGNSSCHSSSSNSNQTQAQKQEIKVVGDVHGQFSDLLRIFRKSGHPSNTSYLFLGDYVDRGNKSLNVISLLFAYSIKYPDSFFLLRGNHEIEYVNQSYGFFEECTKRATFLAFTQFNSTFNYLPLAALIDSRVFCCHGGLAPDLEKLDQLDTIPKHLVNTSDNSIANHLLWNDPHYDDDAVGWSENARGGSTLTFGRDILDNFLEKNGLSMVVRAHESIDEGYKMRKDNKLCTVFSAPNYCNTQGNQGAVMTIGSEGKVKDFEMYDPFMSDNLSISSISDDSYCSLDEWSSGIYDFDVQDEMNDVVATTPMNDRWNLFDRELTDDNDDSFEKWKTDDSTDDFWNIKSVWGLGGEGRAMTGGLFDELSKSKSVSCDSLLFDSTEKADWEKDNHDANVRKDKLLDESCTTKKLKFDYWNFESLSQKTATNRKHATVPEPWDPIETDNYEFNIFCSNKEKII